MKARAILTDSALYDTDRRIRTLLTSSRMIDAVLSQIINNYFQVGLKSSLYILVMQRFTDKHFDGEQFNGSNFIIEIRINL